MELPNKQNFEKMIEAFPKAKKKSETIKKVEILSSNPETLKVNIAVNDKDINELIDKLSEFNVKSFKENKYTLEDYFMQFYREDKDFGGTLWKKK